MKAQVKALDSFHHGHLNARRGEIYTMDKAQADELEKAGLVELAGDAADDAEDDLAPKKAAPILSNKMAPKATNKAAEKAPEKEQKA